MGAKKRKQGFKLLYVCRMQFSGAVSDSELAGCCARDAYHV